MEADIKQKIIEFVNKLSDKKWIYLGVGRDLKPTDQFSRCLAFNTYYSQRDIDYIYPHLATYGPQEKLDKHEDLLPAYHYFTEENSPLAIINGHGRTSEVSRKLKL